MGVEEADLAAGRVGDLVGVEAGGEERVGVADADAHDAGAALGGVGLGIAVAGDREDVEVDFALVAVRILEAQREVPEDAAADLVALGVDGDRLGDFDRAVGGEVDVGTEGGDLFLRQRTGGEREEDEEQGEDARHARAQEKETLGTTRSSGFSISKYSAFSKPKAPATRLEGKLSTLMFRSRAAPL